MRDPHYQAILHRLGEALDPNMFEACAADLLRDALPGLVPVVGGGDAGMDGAVADGEGEAYPLICTTREEFARNLRQSLKSCVDSGLKRRQAVFVTSRPVAPGKRRELEEIARRRDFTLVQVVDRHGIANLLYHSPRWTRDLLGLSGRPSALTAVPLTRRPVVGLEPIGREADLEWLRTTPGDRLLSGQPGSGKTFLCRQLVKEGRGLFLASDDLTAIANALRELQPEVVIVDDAHLEPRRVRELTRLRSEIDADFALVVTTWPGERGGVKAALGGAEEPACRELELLTRSQILEIIRGAGVAARDEVMRELVDQAANKPGLAVTVALAWLRGDQRGVLLGEVLAQALGNSLAEVVGAEVEDLLACFAVGGDRGVGMEVVAAFLGLPVLQVRRRAVGLATAGVLSEVSGGTLAVWPRALRSALVRRTFLGEMPGGRAASLRYEDLLPSLDRPEGGAAEVMVASLGSERIEEQELHALIERYPSDRAWQALASRGEDAARWAMEQHPQGVLGVVRPALHRAPGDAVRELLQLTLGDRPESDAEAAWRKLSDWSRDLTAGTKELTTRRGLLVREARRLSATEARAAVSRALLLALRARLESTSTDPAKGMTVTLSWGLINGSMIDDLREIWRGNRELITVLDRDTWSHLTEVLWEWIYPRIAASEVSEELSGGMRQFAVEILRDLAPLATGSPGLAAGLSRLAARLGRHLDLTLDPAFELLYPPDETEALEVPSAAEVEERRARLLSDWQSAGPEAVAASLATYQAEARRVGVEGSSRGPELCRLLAGRTTEPLAWFIAFRSAGLTPDLARPFLERSAQEAGISWERQVRASLADELYRPLAVLTTLTSPAASADLVAAAVAAAPGCEQWVEGACHRRAVPLATVEALLASPRHTVSLAAAIGEWMGGGGVRESLEGAWRAVILRSIPPWHDAHNVFWLGEILAADPELAFDWLSLSASGLNDHLASSLAGTLDDTLASRAIAALSAEQRAALLERLVLFSPLADHIPQIVGGDVGLFRQLLKTPHLAPWHLAPLRRLPESTRTDFAKLALDAGHGPRELAEAMLAARSWSWTEEIEHWGGWVEGFSALEKDERLDLREVGRCGRELAEARLRAAREERRAIELHGL